MEKIPQCIFIVAWLSLVLIGVVNPKNIIKSFPTSFRMMGIDPSNPSKGVLTFFRIAWFIFFVLGLSIFIGVLTGKIK